MDKIAVANFISETAFSYAYEIAGAVLGVSAVLILTLSIRNHLMRRIYRE